MAISEARKAYNASYYQANKEKTRAYYQANKERLAAYYVANRENIVAYREANKEQIAASKKSYSAANREKIVAYYQANKEQIAAYYRANKEQIAACHREYRQGNPGKINAHTSKRRAAKMQRTPSWLTREDYHAIRTLYETAAALTKATGIKHQVDHILPLRGKTVSGFHCPTNLQILTATENRSKYNKFTGDE